MKFYVVASGSKGNATIIESNSGHLIQIDMGVTNKYLKEQLKDTHINMEDIEALLITHEHSDHIKCASSFPNEKIYSALGTYEVPDTNVLELYKKYNIAGFDITILATSHDAKNPIGFVIEADNPKLIYMTDTGYISERNLKYMQNPDYICIESNHNVKKLFETSRPAYLIMRILGDEGHLSNEDSAMYMSEIIGENTKEIVLMHLSEEANTPELALSTYNEILTKKIGDISKIRIIAAKQREMVTGGEKVSL